MIGSATTTDTSFRQRVLVVEDETLLVMALEDMLDGLGLDVIGPAMNLSHALELSGRERFDAAILDVNLGGELSFPVADQLCERGIPFVFATGYGMSVLESNYSSACILSKPFEFAALKTALSRIGVAVR